MTITDNPITWQDQLAQAITNPVELINTLQLDADLIPSALAVAKLFSLRVPRGFVARMQLGNPADPLLRQVLPLAFEQQQIAGYSADPLAEQQVNPIPGLLHKYHGRVLLTVTGACGVNCRYCFRRSFPYEKNNPGMAGWEQALTYIANDKTINEVILSGGDPLAVSDTHLSRLTQKIAAIAHVKTLRIHTRLPIVIPERITPSLLAWFTGSRLKPVLVTHCNHANEINEAVKTAMTHLKQAGVVLLNQAVLLKGVNDSATALVALHEAIFECDILPYYLHMLDKVQGAAHFEVSEAQAQALHWQMTQQLPGYLVPRLVREVPGAPAKLRVGDTL